MISFLSLFRRFINDFKKNISTQLRLSNRPKKSAYKLQTSYCWKDHIHFECRPSLVREISTRETYYGRSEEGQFLNKAGPFRITGRRKHVLGERFVAELYELLRTLPNFSERTAKYVRVPLFYRFTGNIVVLINVIFGETWWLKYCMIFGS